VKIKITNQSDVSPLSLEEVKEHLRILHSEDDNYITSLIASAESMCTQITNRQLRRATIELYHDTWKREIKLPRPPFVSVVSVQYQKDDDSWVGFSDYVLDEFSEPSAIYPNTFPTIKKGKNVLKVTYQAGYEDGKVPEQIRLWMKMKIATWYENREEVVVGVSVAEISKNYVNNLLDSYRIVPI